MEKQKSNLYIITKTIIYRLLSVSMNWVLLWLLIDDVKKAGKFAVITFIAHTVFYIIYEKLATIYDERYYYNKSDNA